MRASSSTYAARIRRFRLPRLCMPVVGSDASAMIERAELPVQINNTLNTLFWTTSIIARPPFAGRLAPGIQLPQRSAATL